MVKFPAGAGYWGNASRNRKFPEGKHEWVSPPSILLQPCVLLLASLLAKPNGGPSRTSVMWFTESHLLHITAGLKRIIVLVRSGFYGKVPEINFSHSAGGWKSRPRWWSFGSWWEPSCLADGRVLAVSSHTQWALWRLPLIKTLIRWSQGPTLTTLLTLTTSPFQIQTHWGIELKHKNLEGTQFRPEQRS